jgi:hypothetical protein
MRRSELAAADIPGATSRPRLAELPPPSDTDHLPPEHDLVCSIAGSGRRDDDQRPPATTRGTTPPARRDNAASQRTGQRRQPAVQRAQLP